MSFQWYVLRMFQLNKDFSLSSLPPHELPANSLLEAHLVDHKVVPFLMRHQDIDLLNLFPSCLFNEE